MRLELRRIQVLLRMLWMIMHWYERERLLLQFRHVGLLLFALMAFWGRFDLDQSLSCAGETAHHTIIIRARTVLLQCLALLLLCHFAFVFEMRRDSAIDVVETCDFWFNDPRGTCPCFASDSLLDE